MASKTHLWCSYNTFVCLWYWQDFFPQPLTLLPLLIKFQQSNLKAVSLGFGESLTPPTSSDDGLTTKGEDNMELFYDHPRLYKTNSREWDYGLNSQYTLSSLWGEVLVISSLVLCLCIWRCKRLWDWSSRVSQAKRRPAPKVKGTSYFTVLFLFSFLPVSV